LDNKVIDIIDARLSQWTN